MQSQAAASIPASSPPPAAIAARVQALRARHEALSNKIELEQSRPGSSEWYLRALKTQKLHLKEEIEALTSSSH